MLIYAVDDEPLLLKMLEEAIRRAEPDVVVRSFDRANMLMAALQEGHKPDVIFTDIEMPGMTGLELAAQVKMVLPETKLVFVTGFSQYAVEAYRLHVNGYIMKPVTSERIREELDVIKAPCGSKAAADKLQVRCFGYFDVFYRGLPLIFQRRKTKELLAYLVDRKGAVCDAGELITALWEGEGDLTLRKSYLRALTTDLRRTLAEVGMEDVLIRCHNQWAVRTERLDCDYYHMLDGDMSAVNVYHGEYMLQYSWAELTGSHLQFSR